MKESVESMLWDFIVDNNIATEDECILVTDINGFSKKSLLNILHARTGLRSIKQARDEGYNVSTPLAQHYGLNKQEND